LFLSPLEAFASEQSDEDIRRRTLEHALTHLHVGPLTARELVRLIDDPAIDRHTINSVLSNEGRDRVHYDDTTHTYDLKQLTRQAQSAP